MSSGGLWSWPSRPCEWPAKRLRGRPVSRTVTLRRARPSCRAAARPAKLPPMMMTSFMVMGSVLWMEGGWAGPGARYRPALRARDGQRGRPAAAPGGGRQGAIGGHAAQAQYRHELGDLTLITVVAGSF